MTASRPTTRTTSRRGRPRAGERAARERAVLEAAMAELVEHGVEKMTMLSVAKRAGASKETLYSWFGNREGLLRALIERNADTSAERVAAALTSTGDDSATDDSGTDNSSSADNSDALEILTGYATGLLTLLTAPPSLALNRAAMSDPELATVLLQGGRHRVGPIVERFLADQAAAGRLPLTIAPSEAFELLYGLVVQDTQIRVLLGESPPTPTEIASRAAIAVERFARLATET